MNLRQERKLCTGGTQISSENQPGPRNIVTSGEASLESGSVISICKVQRDTSLCRQRGFDIHSGGIVGNVHK